MNNGALAFLTEHFNAVDKRDLEDALLSETTVFEEPRTKHRWWTDIFKVIRAGDRYFSFVDAETTGDLCAEEAGWEFDLATVQEVVPQEVVTVRFVPAKQ